MLGNLESFNEDTFENCSQNYFYKKKKNQREKEFVRFKIERL